MLSETLPFNDRLDTDNHTNEATHGIGEIERARFQQWLRRYPIPDISNDEVEAYFRAMPARYWQRVSEDELLWGLVTAHRFFDRLTAPQSSGTSPVVDWKHFPARGFTEVMVCTWDRRGLLAKIAGCLSAVNLNIIRAGAYTRNDNAVIDIFRVCDLNRRHVTHTDWLNQMVFLLEGALSEPPRFASVWACERHRILPRPPDFSPSIHFDNANSPAHTVFTIETSDRLGLLYDILQGLTDSGLDIAEAFIDTVDDIARDIFFVTDANGSKIIEPLEQQEIRNRLLYRLGQRSIYG